MISIKEARLQHLSTIYRLEASAFTDNWSMDDFMPYLIDSQLTIIDDELGREKHETRSGLVAIDKGKIIGYLFFRYHEKSNYVRLTNLAIEEYYRRQGIASKLIITLLRGAKRCQPVVVSLIRETNLPAQILLRELGFKWIATLDNCYDSIIESGYLMVLSLKRGNITIDHALYKILEGN